MSHSTQHACKPARRGSSRRLVRTALGLALLAVGLPASLPAADLTVGDGVVVKFGPDAQLVVRDKLATGTGVTLTSARDDSAGGQSGNVPQTAAAGDWSGVRIEKSAAAFGPVPFNDVLLRYAGATDGAALTLRGVSPGL